MSYQKYDSWRSLRWKRQSIHLPKHTYTWGAYFVTIRAKQHTPLLEIPELHNILIGTWEALPERFPGVSLDEFVIMPDHIHFILWLDDNVEHPPTLYRVLQVYKSTTTVAWLKHIKLAGLERSGKFWQRRYFERVIRDSRELEQTRRYIQDNPRKLCTPECTCEEDDDQSNDQ